MEFPFPSKAEAAAAAGSQTNFQFITSVWQETLQKFYKQTMADPLSKM